MRRLRTAVAMMASGYALLFGASNAQAAFTYKCWAAPGNGSWNDPSNWSPAGVPGPNDIALLEASGNGCQFGTPRTITVSSSTEVGGIAEPEGLGEVDIDITSNSTLTISGDTTTDPSAPSLGNVDVADGSTLKIAQGGATSGGSFTLHNSGALDIEGELSVLNSIAISGGNTAVAAGGELSALNGNVNINASKLDMQGTVNLGPNLFIDIGSAATNGPVSHGTWNGDPNGTWVWKLPNGADYEIDGPINGGSVEVDPWSTGGSGSAPPLVTFSGTKACTLDAVTIFTPSELDVGSGRTCTAEGTSGKPGLTTMGIFGGRGGAGTLRAASATLGGAKFTGGGLTEITGPTTMGTDPNAPTITGGSTIKTDGATTWQGGVVTLDANSTWENAGALTIDNTRNVGPGLAAGPSGAGVLRNDAGGTITRQAPTGPLGVATPVQNAGTVNVNAGSFGADDSTGTFTQSGGATHVAAGATLDLPSLLNGGTLGGSGTVKSIDNEGGTVVPGDTPPGTLNVAGTYTQGAGGTLEERISGSAPTQSDHLVVGGAATLDGALHITVDPVFAPGLADTFGFLSAASRGGELASLTGDTTTHGLTFAATYGATSAGLCFEGATGCAPAPASPPAASTSAPSASVPGPLPVVTHAPTIKTVNVSSIAKLPAAKACTSRRHFLIRLRIPKGKKIVRAVVRVTGKSVKGKKVKVLRGKRLTSRIVLTGLPKGTFKVQISLIAGDGSTIRGSRTYHTCVKRSRSKHKPKV